VHVCPSSPIERVEHLIDRPIESLGRQVTEIGQVDPALPDTRALQRECDIVTLAGAVLAILDQVHDLYDPHFRERRHVLAVERIGPDEQVVVDTCHAVIAEPVGHLLHMIARFH